LTALRCAMACFENNLEQAEVYAEQALDGLPKSDHTYRAIIYHVLGDTYRRIGRWKRARECYDEVLGLSQDPTYQIRSVHVYGALADLDLNQGQLRSAATNWQRALEEIPRQKPYGSLPLPVIGWVYIRMGEILYEWNQFTETRSHVFRGLEHAELGGDARAMAVGYLIAAKLMLAEGNLDEAGAFLLKSQTLFTNNSFEPWYRQFERLQIELWFAQGRSRSIVQWLDDKTKHAELTGSPQNSIIQRAIIRALILQKDRKSLEEALLQTENLRQAATSEGRTGILIEALALRAVAFWNHNQPIDALTALEQTLRLAEPEGYVRLFVDLGLSMGRLLQEALTRDVRPDYVSTLLAAFDPNGEMQSSGHTVLPEPLTPREQEILTLIASGLTNHETAEKLVISPETGKKHTSNIYTKLGVNSRMQAVARARELKMLV
jgi:LuxR family maltose regulon positive regulatory protein